MGLIIATLFVSTIYLIPCDKRINYCIYQSALYKPLFYDSLTRSITCRKKNALEYCIWESPTCSDSQKQAYVDILNLGCKIHNRDAIDNIHVHYCWEVFEEEFKKCITFDPLIEKCIAYTNSMECAKKFFDKYERACIIGSKKAKTFYRLIIAYTGDINISQCEAKPTEILQTPKDSEILKKTVSPCSLAIFHCFTQLNIASATFSNEEILSLACAKETEIGRCVRYQTHNKCSRINQQQFIEILAQNCKEENRQDVINVNNCIERNYGHLQECVNNITEENECKFFNERKNCLKSVMDITKASCSIESDKIIQLYSNQMAFDADHDDNDCLD